MYVCVCVCIYIYIYIYRERERERGRHVFKGLSQGGNWEAQGAGAAMHTYVTPGNGENCGELRAVHY